MNIYLDYIMTIEKIKTHKLHYSIIKENCCIMNQSEAIIPIVTF
jgi:hypothetical protein